MLKRNAYNSFSCSLKRTFFVLSANRRSGSGVHSPYLYRFVTSVLFNPWNYYALEELKNRPEVRNSIRTTKQKRLYEFFFRITQDLQPVRILDFGPRDETESLYLQAGCPGAEFLYENNTQDITKNVENSGTQDNSLLILLSAEDVQATKLWNTIAAKAGENSIVIIRKPHLNAKTKKVWQNCKTSSSVHSSIDLYHTGVLFFRKDLPDNHLKYKL